MTTASAGRARVFKLAGHWVWTCHHEHWSHGPAGCCETLDPREWRDAWTAALARATGHVAAYHRGESVEDHPVTATP